MKQAHLMAHAALAACLLSGCFSHAVRISVRHPEAPAHPLDEEEIARAVEIVTQVAEVFGLTPSPGLSTYQRANAEDARILAVYDKAVRESTLESVILLVFIEKADGRFVVLVRDWRHRRATGFTGALETRLTESLAAAFGPRSTEFKVLHDMPIWYVP